jgi:glycerol-3-phosphate dehydrogenase (NAD(P)+)
MERREKIDVERPASPAGEAANIVSDVRQSINITVVGAGAWGTALSMHAAKLGHNVRLWAFEPDVVDAINTNHENTPYLPGVRLHDSLRASNNLEETIEGSDMIILATPSQHLRKISRQAADFVGEKTKVVVASKGIEESSLELLSTVLEETLPEVDPKRTAFLSGPSFAREVASGLPTNLVSASSSPDVNSAVRQAMHAPNFRIYDSNDVVGVQLGGAIKNVIAIAAGACDGLNLGTNARAALVTRGLIEMTRLGVALGANPMTFMGLSGMGDLVLTCTGDLSRNRQLGLNIAKGADPKDYVTGHRSVAEGYYTADAAWNLAKQMCVDMPITEQVYQVLHQGKHLPAALRTLTERDSKGEFAGIVPAESD